MAEPDARQQAVTLLLPVLRQQASLSALSGASPLVQVMCYGVCRYYYQLDFLARQLVKKKPGDDTVYCLILLGIYQLLYMDTAAYAVVSETVETSKRLKKKWASKLINGVLRNFQRQQTVLLEKIKQHPIALYAHPAWLISAIKTAYPKQWQEILQANNQHPPMTLRVNAQKNSRDAYYPLLEAQSIAADLTPLSAIGIQLEIPMSIDHLPGFREGLVSLQDEAAQLAAGLLNCQTGNRVLDACAAPGGKTCHLLETYPSIVLTAVDNQASRVEKIQQNLHRLQLQATVKTADVMDVDAWWDGQLFDRILLDAPCSATGVIRRHADIKLLRRESDIAQFAETQFAMLEVLWGLLKPTGKLLYATCSILPQENRQVIERFLAAHDEASWLALSDDEKDLQLLPGHHDGFYYALLGKLG